MVELTLYGPASSRPFYTIRTEAITDRQGKDVQKFTGKVLTALLSICVRLPCYLKASVKARSPGT
jgi:hypothetical protein